MGRERQSETKKNRETHIRAGQTTEQLSEIVMDSEAGVRGARDSEDLGSKFNRHPASRTARSRRKPPVGFRPTTSRLLSGCSAS